jgi:hypothetical protein
VRPHGALGGPAEGAPGAAPLPAAGARTEDRRGQRCLLAAAAATVAGQLGFQNPNHPIYNGSPPCGYIGPKMACLLFICSFTF